MPVATLTYKLPEEREEHARERLKYGDLGPEATAEVEALRRLLYDEVQERGLPVE